MAESILRVKILGDSRGLQQSLKGVGQNLNNLAPRLKSIGASLSTRLTLPLGLAGAASIKMASDLEESFNKVDVAFGSSSKEVREFAKTTLESFGIAQGTALDMAAMFGDMSTSMGLSTGEAADMSTALVGLAGDLASFKNINIDEVTTALSGVFTGETESLKRLGIVMTEVNLKQFAMSQGIQKNIKDMTQAEKVALRFQYVLSVTGNSQGDFARTSGGAANQMRIFQESMKELGSSFGQIILPAFTKLVKRANNILKVFKNLDPSTKKIVVAIAALAAALPPLIYAVGALTTAFGALSLVSVGVTAGLAALIGALAATAKYNALNKSIETLNGTLEELRQKEEETSKTANDSAEAQKAHVRAVRERTKAELELLKLQQDKSQGAIAKLLGIESEEYKALGEQIKITEDKLKGYDLILNQVTVNTKTKTKAIKDEKDLLDQLVITYDDLEDKAAQAHLEGIGLKDFVDVDKALKSAEDFDPSGVDYVDTEAEQDLYDLFDMLAKTEDEAQKAEEKLKQLGQTVGGQVGRAFTDLGRNIVNSMGLGESAMGSFAATFLSTMIDSISAATSAAIANAVAAGTFGSLGSGPLAPFVLPALVAGAISAVKTQFATNVPALAQGGIVSAPTLAMVGDNFGAGSGNPEVIAPLNKLQGMLGNNNVNVGGEFRIQGQDLVVALQRAERNRKRIL